MKRLTNYIGVFVYAFLFSYIRSHYSVGSWWETPFDFLALCILILAGLTSFGQLVSDCEEAKKKMEEEDA